MKVISLSNALQQLKTLSTSLGDFTYIDSLGEGGNSFVYLFEKGNKSFAIKFLKHNVDSKKLNRFKDEYFCAIQIATHKNIVQTYHFDSVSVNDDNYYIIVMKAYQKSLHGLGSISQETEEIKSKKGWKLFQDLLQALKHLHENKIIHRDIKPQNIFFDQLEGEFVIGDLGIAHFSDEDFPKLAKTTPSERLANFSFSAPEQVNSKDPAIEPNDIYSLGQVMQWYLAGEIVRGLDRKKISNSQSSEKLRWIDSVVNKCLKNNPTERFQSVDQIYSFLENLKEPAPKNLWNVLHKFDDVIRRTFPKINGVLSISDETQMRKFFSNFNNECNPDDFWYMSVNEGDNTYQHLTELENGKWLFCGEEELDVEKLIIYRDSHYPYRNFFVLLIEPSEPFEIVDSTGNQIAREIPEEWRMDAAVFWSDQYIDCSETRNGYYDNQGTVIPVSRELFSDRVRHLKPFAYIVVPEGTPTAYMMDRHPTGKFLQSIILNSEIQTVNLEEYFKETRGHLNPEISKWL
ncbi:protein kinase [Methylophilus sp. QUAN]|uniref:protein kinase domain-containing protein n=1 Tax=Methylophilus sp. QUAN TaxID=2781020 RepID=UPI00188EDEED|nr:protein kinase [Methylophilus sp. QUAN]MBF4990221.1 protein kinase [Methylophilus sp. QUAN]